MHLYLGILILISFGLVEPKLLIEDSLLKSMRKGAFLFDKLQQLEAHKSVLTHPYLKNNVYFNHSATSDLIKSDQGYVDQLDSGNSNQSTVEQLQILELLYPESMLLGNEKSIKRKRRSIGKFDLPTIQLSILLNVPLVEVHESTWIFFQMFTFEDFDLVTTNRIQAREWREKVDPALSSLEELVSMLGVDGDACVLRAVCDLAASPDITPEGLVGDMVRVFFYYLVSSEPPHENELDKTSSRGPYHRASLIGRETGLCQENYPGCPISLYNLIDQEA